MKDITEEITGKIYKNEEELKNRKTFSTSTGKDIKMTDDIFNKMISLQRYYECTNLQDIKNDWKNLSKYRRVPLSILAWFGQQYMKQNKENPRFMEEVTKEGGDYREKIDEFVGKKRGFFDKFKKFELPSVPSCSIYLDRVVLEKVETDKPNPLGDEYTITDIHGNVIIGVHINENKIHEIFDNKHTNPSKTRDQLNQLRLDPRPAVVVVAPLQTKEPKLQIIRIQSGGKAIEPLVPTVPGF